MSLENQSNQDLQMTIKPQILLQGGVVELDLPLHLNPFEYQSKDFMVEHTPLKMLALSTSSFIGEVVELSSLKQNHIRYIQNGKVLLEEKIYTPQLVSTGYKELGDSFAVDKEDQIYFLDIQKNHFTQYFTTIYKTNSQFSPVTPMECPKKQINSFTVNAYGDLFFTCHQEQNLYKLSNQKDLSIVAQGLGLPNGLACVGSKIFIADQTGNLFEYDENTQQTLFLTTIPENYRGYHLEACDNGTIYIVIPSSTGKNEILQYNKGKDIVSFIETFSLLGLCKVSKEGVLYWIETSRKESVLYRFQNGEKQKVLSGGFFKGLFFKEDGTLYITNHHTIFKIKKEWLYVK